ncbi:nad2 (mitochondrion) [Ooceraea biroi]|uniref:NADH-ubiquinone oxidoreductase chain 2 n=1 Tax=Ooceraea biroi TaxID=2015173 RepID=A0A3L8D1Z5_OOCBI|nr:nad2 [Ooceraea biroi]
MFYYYLNLFILALSTLITLLTNDLIMIWFIMEINNFMYTTHLTMYMKNKKMIFLYFFIQITASFILIISLTINSLKFNNLMILILMMSSLLMKLGLPPFHLWLPLISMHMKWFTIFILFTIQKIIPFVLMWLLNFHSSLFFLPIILSMIIPPFMMLNINNFKKFMAYSSINQTGWMLLLILFSSTTWMFYFMFYSLTFFLVTSLFKIFKIKSFSWLKSNFFMKFMMMFSMMNMSGLPPFSFFIIKWYTMFLFISSTKLNIIMPLIMLFSSLLMLYIYINLIVKMTLTHSSNIKLIIYPSPLMTPPSPFYNINMNTNFIIYFMAPMLSILLIMI